MKYFHKPGMPYILIGHSQGASDLYELLCATPEIKSYHQLSLSWGVFPVLARYQKDYDTLMLHAVDCAKQIDLVEAGDVAVIVAGVPLGFTGNTNLIKIENIN